MTRITQTIGLKKLIGLSLGEHIAEIGGTQEGVAETRSQLVLDHVAQLLSTKLADVLDGPGQSDLSGVIDGDREHGLERASSVTSSLNANAAAVSGHGAFVVTSLLEGSARADIASAKSESGTLDSYEGGGVVSGDGYGALGFPEAGVGDVGSPNGGAPALNAPLELLVQFDSAMGAAQFAAVAAALGGKVVETIHTAAMADVGSGVLVRMSFGQGLTIEQAMNIASKLPGVEFAEPNWGISVQTTINEPYFTDGKLWGMYSELSSPANQYGSQAYDAWAAGYTGSSSTVSSTGVSVTTPSKTVVGVIDTGIDYTHPDLYLNIWINQLEIPESIRGFFELDSQGTLIGGLDFDKDGQVTFYDLNRPEVIATGYVTDSNNNQRIDAHDLLQSRLVLDNSIDIDAPEEIDAYQDDIVGWDFVNDDNNPFDDHNHGTHVGGTIGSIGDNGTGVVGVAWDVQLMALKFLSESGSGTTLGAIKAVDYYTAVSQAASLAGVDQNFVATNNSWGGGGYSQALFDAIVRGAQQDSLFIAAAGNGGFDGKGDNNDRKDYWPANYNTTEAIGWDAVIAVAAINSNGTKASFSNYGATTVELGAPGSYIWSTVPGGSDPAVANDGSYARYSGTSMATPHVAGAVALYAAANPDATAQQIRDALLASVAPTESLKGKTMTDGRLDVGTLLGSAPIEDTTAPAVLSVAYGDNDGTLKAGEIVTLTVAMSEAVTVTVPTDGVAPTLSLNSGSTVAIFDAGKSNSTHLAFTYTVGSTDTAADLEATAFNLSDATITDAAGNAYLGGPLQAEATGILEVDTTAPAQTAMITGVNDDQDPQTGTVANGGTTDDTSPELSGTISDPLATGEVLAVYRDDTKVGTATVAELNWTFTDSSVPEGTYSYTVRVEDAAGNQGAASGPYTITVNTPELTPVYGTDGSDSLVTGDPSTTGDNIDEVISGLAEGSSTLGGGTIDTLFGDGGNDVFIFGDTRGHYYDDGSRKTDSTSDHAVIQDFSDGDTIQLHGSASKYLVSNTSLSSDISGAGIYVDANANLKLDNRDELIGLVEARAASDLAFSMEGEQLYIVWANSLAVA